MKTCIAIALVKYAFEKSPICISIPMVKLMFERHLYMCIFIPCAVHCWPTNKAQLSRRVEIKCELTYSLIVRGPSKIDDASHGTNPVRKEEAHRIAAKVST